MPIGQIKALSWFVAALLTLGLSGYVYTFITELKQREQQGFVDQAEIKTALEDVPEIQEQKDDLIDYERVKSLFHEGRLNWTGYVPPAPTPAGPVAQVESKPKYKPVADLLRVLMLQVDPVDETQSRTWVHYKPESKVAPASVVGVYSLRVGDALHAPNGHIKVKAMGPDESTGRMAVTFAFDDEARKPESVGPELFDATTMIVQVDDVTGLRIPTTTKFPVGTYRRPTRTETRQISPNKFVLGEVDMEQIGVHFPTYVNEIHPRRHRDPRTGRYDGIEIGDVPAGSMGARHGAETGDIIKSINGHPVTSPSEAINFAKNNADKFDTWEIVVERRGKEITVTYTSN